MNKPAIFVLIIGIGVSISTLIQNKKGSEVENWDSTSGVIISSRLDSRQIGSKHSTRHKAVIEFEYIVKGTTYRSKTIYPGHDYRKNIKFSKKYIEKYTINKEVEVFYNPKEPNMAILEPDFQKMNNNKLIGGVSLILLSIFLFFKMGKTVD